MRSENLNELDATTAGYFASESKLPDFGLAGLVHRADHLVAIRSAVLEVADGDNSLLLLVWVPLHPLGIWDDPSLAEA